MKKSKKTLFLSNFFVVFLLFFLFSCGAKEIEEEKYIEFSEYKVRYGESIKPTKWDVSYRKLSFNDYIDVKWDGMVEGKKLGTGIIRYEVDGEIKQEVKIVVYSDGVYPGLNNFKVLYEGESITLKPCYFLSESIYDRFVNYDIDFELSYDHELVNFDKATNKLTALKEGVAEITIESGDYKNTSYIYILNDKKCYDEDYLSSTPIICGNFKDIRVFATMLSRIFWTSFSEEEKEYDFPVNRLRYVDKNGDLYTGIKLNDKLTYFKIIDDTIDEDGNLINNSNYKYYYRYNFANTKYLIIDEAYYIDEDGDVKLDEEMTSDILTKMEEPHSIWYV